MKKITDNDIRWTMNNRYNLYDKKDKFKCIKFLIDQDKFELIKEYFNSTRLKEYYTEIYNGRVQLNNARIENYKKQIKELKKEIKEDNAMMNKLKQNL